VISGGSKNTLTAATEAAVVGLAMTGDDRAFEELVRRRQGAIRKLMLQLCGDRVLADDYAQEAFVLAWRKIHALRSPAAFGGWLKRIAINIHLQHVRRTDLAAPTDDEPAAHPATGSGNPAARMDLESALARLSSGERLCVALSYGQGMSHGEICEATKLPLGTVKSHISRGCARLRRYLSAYEEQRE
jgi:RNA polymerase sigma factor (sigma-70 family)